MIEVSKLHRLEYHSFICSSFVDVHMHIYRNAAAATDALFTFDFSIVSDADGLQKLEADLEAADYTINMVSISYDIYIFNLKVNSSIDYLMVMISFSFTAQMASHDAAANGRIQTKAVQNDRCHFHARFPKKNVVDWEVA